MFSQVMSMNGRVTRLLFLILLIMLAVVATLPGQMATAATGSGIVHSVVNAPIVPDGNVAGAKTDVVINLDGSLDPSVPGSILQQGHQIKITLPDDFVSTGMPVQTNFTPDCNPAFPANCSTGLLLQGWPQHPIFPMFPPGSGPPALYTTTLEGTHTFVFTALQDIEPGVMLPGPGIKQIHLIALGFINPAPGFYDIEVMAQTGPGGAWESGTGQLQIVPRARPSINVTSIFNGPTNPNTIYQQAGINELINLPYDFLLWDYDSVPFTGVDIEMVNSGHALMRQGEAVVGHVFIDAPQGAEGPTLSATAPSFAINAPLSGVPTGRLNISFTTGDQPGLYTVTFSLNGGNSVTMYVMAD